LIYNTTRAGVARAELDRVALPGDEHGFRMAQEAGDRATATESERPRAAGRPAELALER
jgi:hypothetical protein